MKDKVIVAGWRDYGDEDFVRSELTRRLKERLAYIEIITGECQTGVDLFAKRWALELGLGYKGFHANWTKFGISAGPIRNFEMAEYAKNEMCLLFNHPKSKGKKSLISACKKYDVLLIEIPIT